jgi:hypothetical protein
MSTRRVAFQSEPEALAFIDGIDFMADYAVGTLNVSTEGPDIELDSEGQEEYAVYVEEL